MPTCSSTETCRYSCAPGFFPCGGDCVDTTSDDSACGGSCRVCPAGSHCTESECLATYGEPTEFPLCVPGDPFAPGALVGEQVILPVTLTVAEIGVFTAPSEPSGVHAVAALYTNEDGLASQLVVQSLPVEIVPGANAIAVTPTSVPPGAYWIMVEYDAVADPCVDTATTNTTEYELLPYASTLPTSLTGVEDETSSPDINYFVAGLE